MPQKRVGSSWLSRVEIRTTFLENYTMATTTLIAPAVLVLALYLVLEGGNTQVNQTEKEMQDDANEDCSSRQLQLGHPYVHWHPVRNVTEFYYRCDLDVGVKTYCANGTQSNGTRDVVCEVLARGPVQDYSWQRRCECVCKERN